MEICVPPSNLRYKVIISRKISTKSPYFLVKHKAVIG